MRLPPASCTWTTGCRFKGAPSVTELLGLWEKTNLAAGPTLTTKELLVTVLTEPLESVASSVYVPGLSMEQPLNVTTPLTSDWLHPLNFAPGVPEASERVTVELSVKAVFPKVSSTVTTG